MVNRVILVGNLGADPELRQTRSGTSVTYMRLATNSRRKVEGEWKDEVEWHSVTVWGKQADSVVKFLTKGRQVYLEGRLHTRKWQDDGGRDRYTTEIVADIVKFIGSAGSQRNDQPEWSAPVEPAASNGSGAKAAVPYTEDADIPF